ncbi:MAG TPA: NfeD family protein, partial [Gammaproteobacteria bacterium]|nr:NfeD family protein [Gammaproteobacteria bacterium]
MLEQLGHWHWWILGVALLILEVFAPGAFFLWLGIAAGVVGLVVYLLPELAWEYQLLLFSILSVISIVVWRRFFRLRAEDTDQPTLNRRGEQYIGRVFTLETPLVNGMGKIRIDDTTWKIEGPDC